MFNKLFSLLSTESGSLQVLSKTIGFVDEVLDHLEDAYSQDGNMYNASIDAICEILQEHKSKKK